jgi:hypothetical protein
MQIRYQHSIAQRRADVGSALSSKTQRSKSVRAGVPERGATQMRHKGALGLITSPTPARSAPACEVATGGRRIAS